MIRTPYQDAYTALLAAKETAPAASGAGAPAMQSRRFDNEEELRFFLDYLNYVCGDEPAVGGIDANGAFLAFYEDGEGELPLAVVRPAESLEAHDENAEVVCTPALSGAKYLYFPVFVLAGEWHEPTFDPATAQAIWEER